MEASFPEFTISEENIDKQKELVLNQIQENREKIEELLSIPEKTYANFVTPYQLIHERLGMLFFPVSHLNYVKNSPKTQEIYTELITVITEYYTYLNQDERIYRVFKEILQREGDQLSPEKRKVLEDTIKDFELSGCWICLKNKREKVKKINIRLSQLQNQFAQNLLNATDSYEMIIEDYEDVKELPDSDLLSAKTEVDGKVVYRFTLHQPSYISYMSYELKQGKKREQLTQSVCNKSSTE
ncbi:MAG: hypothetical protein Q9M89_03165 [Persephonella sp.]|nr:hypothetical protein [Persephonella sp.]